MASCWFLTVIIWVFAGIWPAGAKTSDCSPIEHKPVKVEAWLSKRYEKELRQLRKEFAAMGNARVTLLIYPEENPAKIVATGRCIPAYIA